MKSSLTDMLKTLRLSGLSSTLEVRLQEASAGRLGYDEFLELLIQDEVNIRQERLIARRTKAANPHFSQGLLLSGFLGTNKQ